MTVMCTAYIKGVNALWILSGSTPRVRLSILFNKVEKQLRYVRHYVVIIIHYFFQGCFDLFHVPICIFAMLGIC